MLPAMCTLEQISWLLLIWSPKMTPFNKHPLKPDAFWGIKLDKNRAIEAWDRSKRIWGMNWDWTQRQQLTKDLKPIRRMRILSVGFGITAIGEVFGLNGLLGVCWRFRHTKPSYRESADTMVSSRLLPSLNSAISSEPFSSLSIILKILRTRFSGVSSSAGSLTMEPTIL